MPFALPPVCPARLPARRRSVGAAQRHGPGGAGARRGLNEDVVRDIATVLNGDERFVAYVVESENFESIHNHSAYALIQRDKGEA